jgi:hypothetical protein
MVGPEFASCHLKLGRAREHFETIKAEVIEWRDSRPYSIRRQSNPETGRHTIIVELRSSPFERWSLIAGDCVSNLRSALDHLIYAFAVRDTGKAVPPQDRKLQFPICDSRAAFDLEVKKGRISGLGSKAEALIESAQPYHRSNVNSLHILTVIREFNDLDKHRLLNVALTHVTQGKIKFVNPRHKGITVLWLRSPVKDGAEIAHFDLQPPDPDVDYKLDVTFDVTVTHVAGPTGAHVSPLGDILSLMFKQVTSVINGAVTS